MNNQLPFGADTLVIPFTTVPNDGQTRPAPTPPKPEEPPRRE